MNSSISLQTGGANFGDEVVKKNWRDSESKKSTVFIVYFITFI